MKTFLAIAFLAAATAFAVEPPPQPRAGVPADSLFFNTKWYRVYGEKLTWHHAQQRCKALGGQLAVVPDEATWKFLTSAIAGNPRLWLGGTDEQTEGLWRWVDGTNIKFEAWHGKPADNLEGKEHYLAMWGNGWNDAADDNSEVVGFICEWRQ
jgi:hypothetical protein